MFLKGDEDLGLLLLREIVISVKPHQVGDELEDFLGLRWVIVPHGSETLLRVVHSFVFSSSSLGLFGGRVVDEVDDIVVMTKRKMNINFGVINDNLINLI